MRHNGDKITGFKGDWLDSAEERGDASKARQILGLCRDIIECA